MKKRSIWLLGLSLVVLLAIGISVLATAAGAGTETGTLKMSLSISSDITLHFWIDLTPEQVEDGASVTFTMNGNKTTIPLKQIEGTRYGADYTGITPQCMNDKIDFSVKSGETVIHSGVFSIVDYCEGLLALSYDDADKDGFDDATGYYPEQFVAMKTLVNDLLVYGGAAQVYTGYKTSELVGEGRVGTEYKLPTTSDLVLSNGEGVTFTAATVNFDNINRIRFRFKAASTKDLVIKSGDQILPYKDAGDGTYIVFTDGIKAADFDRVYTVKAFFGDKEISSVSYSVNSYVKAKKSSSNDALKNLVTATYCYGKSAEAFLEAENYAASRIYNEYDEINLVARTVKTINSNYSVSFTGSASYNTVANGYPTRTVSHTLQIPYNFEVKISTYTDGGKDYDANSAVILYIVGHGEKRVGRESDVSIISSLLDEGYIVTVVDYLGNANAISPYIEQSISALRVEIMKKSNTSSYMGSLPYNKNKTYVLPAGCRIVRDVEFFDWTKHAAKGTLEKVEVENWNRDSVQEKAAAKGMAGTVTDWRDIPLPDGTHMGDACNYEKYLKLHMDIIYPSQPDTEVPVIALAASGDIRNGSTLSTSHPERIGHTGFLMRGYAAACYDHEYHIYSQGEDSWGHIEPSYSLQSYNGIKTHTAAIRCIRYYADQYGYSTEKIGAYGHSKSSYVSALSVPKPEALPENNAVSGYNMGDNYTDEQPFMTYASGEPIPSNVVCVYFSMGDGAKRYEKILTPVNSPALICCGDYDNGQGMTYWDSENAAYYESGAEYLSMTMWQVGHTYPINKQDITYDYNYYHAFINFFDHNLKGEAISMLYTSADSGKIVAAGAQGTRVDSDELFIQFSNAVKAWSLRANTTIVDADGNAVEGKWIAECGGTRWTFSPKTAFKTGIYTLTVGTGICDENDVSIADGYTVKFSVGGASADSETLGKSVIG